VTMCVAAFRSPNLQMNDWPIKTVVPRKIFGI
jgi:hypothetical protein